MSDYYVTMFEQERGPYSADDLQQMAKDGTLSRAALIRCPNGESIRAERIHALWDFVGRKWFPLWSLIACLPTHYNVHASGTSVVYIPSTLMLILIVLCARQKPFRYKFSAVTIYTRLCIFTLMLTMAASPHTEALQQWYLCLNDILLALVFILVDWYYARQYWAYGTTLQLLRS